jgi:PAS domain S-box-containing protein
MTWNPAAERLFGYTAQEAIGRPISIIYPPNHPDEFPAIMERIRHGEHIEHYETVRVRKDGARLDVSVSISPLKNEQGEIIGAAKIARDITERKRSEQVQHFLAEAMMLHSSFKAMNCAWSRSSRICCRMPSSTA